MGNKCKDCDYQFNTVYFYKCPICGCKTDREPPYSQKDYEEAKKQGLDLDNWNDYVNFFGIGEDIQYD